MAWTEITRPRYQREGLRYASDTTDEEWAILAPHLPAPASCGRRRKHELREIVNAIFYIAQTGCQWRLLPSEFPPYTTVQRYYYAWRDDGRWQSINHVRWPRARQTAETPAPRRNYRQPVGEDHRSRRPARLCGREEDQRPQAPYHH